MDVILVSRGGCGVMMRSEGSWPRHLFDEALRRRRGRCPLRPPPRWHGARNRGCLRPGGDRFARTRRPVRFSMTPCSTQTGLMNAVKQSRPQSVARSWSPHDTKSRAKYTALRSRAHSHGCALRSVADRLLNVACPMLKTGTSFNSANPLAKRWGVFLPTRDETRLRLRGCAE
jgi:hypothetical protein